MSDDYCDFCDLPLSQCVHGRPAPAPAPATKAVPKPRVTKQAAPKVRSKPVVRRWTPPEVLAPLVLQVLEDAGGALPADQALARIEERLEGEFAAGDHELTPSGEPRWQYAARRARAALVKDGQLTKDEPGVWRLA
jgi:hypothetical protein